MAAAVTRLVSSTSLHGQESVELSVADEHQTMGQLIAAYLRAGGRVQTAVAVPEQGPDRSLLLRITAAPGRRAEHALAEALQAIDDSLVAVERALTLA